MELKFIAKQFGRSPIPAIRCCMAGLDGLAISWLRLRQMWLSSHTSEDPLAPCNEAIASAEEAIRAELVDLLNSSAERATQLFAFARDIRDKHVGPRIDLRAAIDVGVRILMSFLRWRRP